MKHIEEQIEFLKTVKRRERAICTIHEGFAVFGDAYHLTVIEEKLFVFDIEKLKLINRITSFSPDTIKSMIIEPDTLCLKLTGKELKHNNHMLVEFERSDGKLVYMQKKFLKNIDLKSATFEQVKTRDGNINGGIQIFEKHTLLMYCMPHRVEYYKGANND